MKKDKQERRFKKAKISLMRNPKFVEFAAIMMLGTTSIVDGLPTACTNGRDEKYGREFLEGLSDKEIGFVILHETLHKAFRHLYIWKSLWKRNAQLANMACDYVINLMLVTMDPSESCIAMPKKEGKAIGLVDRRFEGMNSKQVFDILLKENPEMGKGKGGSGSGEAGSGEAGSGEAGEGFDSHDWDGAEELSEGEVKELEKEIDQALRQGQIARSRMQGQGAGNMSRELGELLAPQLDWRELLREFVNSMCSARDASSWRRVNRRYLCMDTYMPSMIGEKIGSIAVGIDTSGSIGPEVLNKFLSEIKCIVDEVHPEKIDLMYWDSEVAGHEVYDIGNMDGLVQSTKPRGGGGTDPRCMMHKVKEENMKPQCIIMLTDGEVGGGWGDEWDAPMLWVIDNNWNKNLVSSTGKTIYMND